MKQSKITFNDETFTVNYIIKANEAEIIAKRLEASEISNFGIDIETCKKPAYKDNKKAGLDPHLSDISIVQIYDGGDQVYIFDALLAGLDWLKYLKNKNFVAHYGIFEIKHFTHNGFPNLNIGCSMLLSILVDRAERSPYVDIDEEADTEEDDEPSSWKGYGLDAITGRLFDVRMDKKFQMYAWDTRPLEKEPLTYAALDAVYTYKICKIQIDKVNEYKMQKHYKLLKQMQHVIVEMELNGVQIDDKQHKLLIASWLKEEKKQKLNCAKHFADVNLNSTKQLAKWATGKYTSEVLTNWITTKKGALGFGKDALAAMQHLPEIAALLLYKKTSKLISTYGESLRTQINPVTKRVHCSFSLGETRTGRLSSREPNLQNLPRDSDMRNLFVASPGKKLIVADFNQIELRVAGEISRDPVILNAYKTGQDLHSIFASKMFKIPLSKVTKEQRQIAKSANFGAIYGMGAAKFVTYTLASTGGAVKLTLEEAKVALDTLWSLYNVYGSWCKKVRDEAKALSFVRTPMGKVRKLHQKEVYTKAPNTIVQGGAFEVMSASMIELQDQLSSGQSKSMIARIINSVHDEIIVEVNKEDADFAKILVEHSMVYGMTQVFPKATINGLAVAKICDKWGEGK